MSLVRKQRAAPWQKSELQRAILQMTGAKIKNILDIKNHLHFTLTSHLLTLGSLQKCEGFLSFERESAQNS